LIYRHNETFIGRFLKVMRHETRSLPWDVPRIS